MLETASKEQILKELFIFCVIGCFLEFQLTASSHVLCKLLWITMTKLLNRGVNFAFFDLSVFIVLISRAETLPWKLSLQQVQNNIACSF